MRAKTPSVPGKTRSPFLSTNQGGVTAGEQRTLLTVVSEKYTVNGIHGEVVFAMEFNEAEVSS